MSKIMAPTQAVGKCVHLHGFSNGFRRLSADDVLWIVHFTVLTEVQYYSSTEEKSGRTSFAWLHEFLCQQRSYM